MTGGGQDSCSSRLFSTSIYAGIGALKRLSKFGKRMLKKATPSPRHIIKELDDYTNEAPTQKRGNKVGDSVHECIAIHLFFKCQICCLDSAGYYNWSYLEDGSRIGRPSSMIRTSLSLCVSVQYLTRVSSNPSLLLNRALYHAWNASFWSPERFNEEA